MNALLKRILMERNEDKRYRGRGRRGDRNYDRAYDRPYDRAYDRADRGDYGMDYAEDYEMDYGYGSDGRRGVKGTGRYGIGGSRYYGRRRDRASDYDTEMGGLGEGDMEQWKKDLTNADGSHGEHFEMSQIMDIAGRMNLKFEDYTEEDLVMTANMLYSDYCEALKSIVPKEKEHIIYTKLAKAFLEDKDAEVKGSDKLALYYYCIVEGVDE